VANSFEIVEGMQFDRGYISPYMVSNAERMEAELNDPYILVTDKKISAIKELLPLLEKMVEAGKKELVIIADEIEGEALATLVVNKIRGIFSAVAMKAPGFGDKKKEMLQDISNVTGAELITEDLGKKFEDADLTSLGGAHRVVSTKDATTIVGGKGDKKTIEDRVAQLKSQIKVTESDYDKEKLQERLGKLSGGVAVIKVGAPTESAQKELKQRVEDAVAATKAALSEGIVAGGGSALLKISTTLNKESKNATEEKQIAHKILWRALEEPFTQIVENAGKRAGEIMVKVKDKILDGQRPNAGYDALNDKVVSDMIKEGIVDPVKVTRSALQNAVSAAAMFLTTEAAIAELPKKEEKGPAMPHEDY
jgi:chaperonin GroEL